MFKIFLIICIAMIFSTGCATQENKATIVTYATPRYQVNINTATADELDELIDGIGPITAAKIVASRGEKQFKSIYDLRERNIIGKALFKKIKGDLTIGTTNIGSSGCIANSKQ